MAMLKRYRRAEEELLNALSDTVRREPDESPLGACPSRRVLRRFVTGRFWSQTERDALLTHLAGCNRCIRVMAGMRQRRVLLQRVLVGCSVLFVAAGLWIWANQHRSLETGTGVVTLDLRVAAPTRGQELPSPLRIKMPTNTGRLRIILPVGSEGSYDAQVLDADMKGPPVARSSGNTQIEEEGVVLNLAVKLSTLRPGNYSLALRRDHREWEYYGLTLE
jgi:hypothetical protein